MGNDQPEKVITLDQPGMTYVVTKEYFILPFTDIAINRSFFTYYSIVLSLFWIIATLIGVYTNWWQTLFLNILSLLYVRYWIIGWTGTFLFIGIVYYRHSRKKKKEKLAKAQVSAKYLGGR